MYASATPSRHFINEMENGAEMNPAGVSGIITGETPSAIGQFFPLSQGTAPEVFAKVNSTQFPFFFLSGEFATRRFAATIFSVTQCYNIVATLFRMVTTLFQYWNAVLR